MKKVINKNMIFGIIIGMLIMSGIGVFAVDYIYNSTQVTYKKADNTEVDVKTALDELYSLPKSFDEVVAYKTGAYIHNQTITVPEGVTDGIIIMELGFYDSSSYGLGGLYFVDESGISEKTLLNKDGCQYYNIGLKRIVYKCKLIPGETITLGLGKDTHSSSTAAGSISIILIA